MVGGLFFFEEVSKVKRQDIAARVRVLLLLAFYLSVLLAGTVGLCWVAWVSGWHWAIRVPAGVLGFLFSYGVINAAILRWKVRRLVG